MPLFTPVNNININSSSYAVKELYIREVNKNAIKHTTAALTKSPNFVPKE